MTAANHVRDDKEAQVDDPGRQNWNTQEGNASGIWLHFASLKQWGEIFSANIGETLKTSLW